MTREGLVVSAALDLRRAPDHRSELRSQLLLGERVRVFRTARGDDWARVENRCDGYRGWVRTWGLKLLSAARARDWAGRARARLRLRHAEVRAAPGGGAVVTPVFWNSRLVPGPRRGRWRSVELPDGRRGWLAADAIGPAGARRALSRVVGELLGTPYLWGGRTPLGFDCSGFVQQVLLVRGIRLPRDAHEQCLACRPLGRASLRGGDLVFFGRPRERVSHVGLLLDRHRYAHARGVVRISSLQPRNALYDSELGGMIATFGRPRAPRWPGRHSC